jgi:hypothetical protein
MHHFFQLRADGKKYYTCHTTKHHKHHKKLVQVVYRKSSKFWIHIIDLIFIELPKFDKTLEQLETLTDKWIYFLKSAMRLESVPQNMEDIPALQRAFQIANQANLSRDELEEQDIYMCSVSF